MEVQTAFDEVDLFVLHSFENLLAPQGEVCEHEMHRDYFG